MTMERMSPLDSLFLHVEDDVSHMHIGSLALFEGPPPRYDEIHALVASKLPLLPRYRQRVRFVPFDLGRPLWIADPRFDLSYHVRHTALPRPGGEAELRRLVGRLMAQQLDRRRPLWEMWIVDGVGQGRWGLISKLHHCMADGISASDLFGVLLDDERRDPVEREDDWQPEPEPSTLRVLTQALGERAIDPREHVRSVRALLRAPQRVAREAAVLASGLVSLRALVGTPAATSLNGPLSPMRQWVWARGRLDEVKKIRGALGGTVNDVVLACVTAGWRTLLESRGEPLEGLTVRTLIPVSVRTHDARGVPDNRVSAMFAELPVGLADPLERLHAISSQMDGLKSSGQAVAGGTLTEMTGFAPPLLLALGARAFGRLSQSRLQTVTTNVPGPQQPLYLARRRMLEAFPYVPLGMNVRIGVAIYSYDGALNFGITGDGEHACDIDKLAQGIERGLAQLIELACERAKAKPADAVGEPAREGRPARRSPPPRSAP